jgi:phage gp36-like protein
MPFPLAITLAPSAARTANGSAAGVDCSARSAARCTLAVSAVSGTSPTLDVIVEASPDQLAWSEVGRFTQRTTTGTQDITVAGCARYMRARWILGGTADPTFTFAVTATAIQAFTAPRDIDAHALPIESLTGISAHDQAEACIAASDELWGRFNGRYTGPLTSWSSDLTKHTSAEAACSLLLTRGVNPDASEYEILKDLRDQARAWADKVGAGKITPVGIVDATPSVKEGGSYAYTESKRGW